MLRRFKRLGLKIVDLVDYLIDLKLARKVDNSIIKDNSGIIGGLHSFNS